MPYNYVFVKLRMCCNNFVSQKQKIMGKKIKKICCQNSVLVTVRKYSITFFFLALCVFTNFLAMKPRYLKKKL